MAIKTKSLRAQKTLRRLGENLKTARLKRRISIRDFAARAGVSDRTVMRLEKGDEGVSAGTLAMALLVLGEIDRLDDLLDPASDDTALLLDREALPKRIVGRRGKSPAPFGGAGQDISKLDPSDDEGVGF